MDDVLVVGAGLFGTTAALALRRRGRRVVLVDPGPLPRPEAASTDVSKVVRLDYGDDVETTAMMEAALPRWREWNERWGETVYDETGLAVLSRSAMQPDGFEHDSFALLSERGYGLERLDERSVAERFPAWRDAGVVDGYWNPVGGWAASGRTIERLLQDARDEGVEVRQGLPVVSLVEAGGRVSGVSTSDGATIRAETVVVAAGAWTPLLLPYLSGFLNVVGQPTVFFTPDEPAAYRGPGFPTFTMDIATTGFYGFPAAENGELKLANHGAGTPCHADVARDVPDAEVERFRRFLGEVLPALATAPLARARLCLYGDSPDGRFLIDRDPERPGLVVAAGGSGHAFKFAPLLGDLTADVVEGRDHPWLARFAWRPADAAAAGDSARAERTT